MRHKTNYPAPYGTCNKCGYEGRDWAFKYQGLCGDCYNDWRKERAERRRLLKPPNDNIAITEGTVVTRNVLNRLTWQSQGEIPLSRTHNLVARWGLIFALIPPLLLLVLYLLHIQVDALDAFVVSVTSLALFFLSEHVSKREGDKRMVLVNDHLKQLAEERKRRIDEMKRFYQSSEWRLLRQQIIKEKGNVCSECKKTINNPNDITVDHIFPRSKYAELALNRENMQVLCRSCNSKKGDAVPDTDAGNGIES